MRRHLPHFNLSPLDQLDTYVGPTWEAIVDTAIGAEAALRHLLARLKPDAIVLDNVVMFPALANSGIPWVRMISCAETELPDPDVPPYLSGMAADDASRPLFERRYRDAVAPAHDRFNRFRAGAGLPALPPGIFLETSPWLNLLLTPEIVRRSAPTRSTPKSSSIWKAASGAKGHSTSPISRAATVRWSISASAASAPATRR